MEGEGLTGGVYVVRLVTGGKMVSREVVLAR